MANVRVAVRVRPLNEREVEAGADNIVSTQGNTLSITNVKVETVSEYGDSSRDRVKHFTFDYCYDCSVDRSHTTDFPTQELVYQDLGAEVLKAASDGYNACLFAYGQTGTGKTFTMMGYPGEIGLTPRICEGLFGYVDECPEENLTFRVEVSYMEIYNERVRDLLKPGLHPDRFTLKVREHPKEGPYVQDLTRHPVKDFHQIQTLLDRGNQQRTTAATHMHQHSSRSHAIVTVHFTQVALCPQAKLEEKLPSEKASKIHLVDLAGSERADPNYHANNYKGRITEGGSINKSLNTLGNVIKALGWCVSTLATHSRYIISNCPSQEGDSRSMPQSLRKVPMRRRGPGVRATENSLLAWSSESVSSTQNSASSGDQQAGSSQNASGRKSRSLYIPYRDSVLTWILKDSLGGNSKTLMIATITPASKYYNESISTLRYAQRAKSIVNKPRVNEDANVSLIRQLRQEIERLKGMLESARMVSGASPSEMLYFLPGMEKLLALNNDMESDERAGSVLAGQDSGAVLSEKLKENEAMANQLTQSWLNKWNEAQSLMQESDLSIRGLGGRSSSLGVVIDSQLPHLIGMDEDILSTGVIIFQLKEGKTLVGREDARREQDIVLDGPGIQSEHCLLRNENDQVVLHPRQGAVCTVNGVVVHEPVPLTQGDVLVLGKTNMYRFNNPAQAAKLRQHRQTLQTGECLSAASSMSSLSDMEMSRVTPLRIFNPKLESARKCLELEQMYSNEAERIQHARSQLDRLRAEVSEKEEAGQEEEERLWEEHEKHREELEAEKVRLARLQDSLLTSKKQAQELLLQQRQQLDKEEESYKQQLQQELVDLAHNKGDDESVDQLTELPSPQQPDSCDPDHGADATDPTDAVITGPAGREIHRRRLSFEGRVKGLAQSELLHSFTHLQAVQQLQSRVEELEKEIALSRQEVDNHIHKIQQKEEQYHNTDISRLDRLHRQKEQLEELHRQEEQLELYLEEKQDLLAVGHAKPRPLRGACSELTLISSDTVDTRLVTPTIRAASEANIGECIDACEVNMAAKDRSRNGYGRSQSLDNSELPFVGRIHDLTHSVGSELGSDGSLCSTDLSEISETSSLSSSQRSVHSRGRSRLRPGRGRQSPNPERPPSVEDKPLTARAAEVTSRLYQPRSSPAERQRNFLRSKRDVTAASQSPVSRKSPSPQPSVKAQAERPPVAGKRGPPESPEPTKRKSRNREDWERPWRTTPELLRKSREELEAGEGDEAKRAVSDKNRDSWDRPWRQRRLPGDGSKTTKTSQTPKTQAAPKNATNPVKSAVNTKSGKPRSGRVSAGSRQPLSKDSEGSMVSGHARDPGSEDLSVKARKKREHPQSRRGPRQALSKSMPFTSDDVLGDSDLADVDARSQFGGSDSNLLAGQRRQNRHRPPSRLRQISSASSLPSVPEAAAESEGDYDAAPSMSDPKMAALVAAVPRRQRRGRRVQMEEEEWRRHSEPVGEQWAEALAQYTADIEGGMGQDDPHKLHYVSSSSSQELTTTQLVSADDSVPPIRLADIPTTVDNMEISQENVPQECRAEAFEPPSHDDVDEMTPRPSESVDRDQSVELVMDEENLDYDETQESVSMMSPLITPRAGDKRDHEESTDPTNTAEVMAKKKREENQKEQSGQPTFILSSLSPGKSDSLNELIASVIADQSEIMDSDYNDEEPIIHRKGSAGGFSADSLEDNEERRASVGSSCIGNSVPRSKNVRLSKVILPGEDVPGEDLSSLDVPLSVDVLTDEEGSQLSDEVTSPNVQQQIQALQEVLQQLSPRTTPTGSSNGATRPGSGRRGKRRQHTRAVKEPDSDNAEHFSDDSLASGANSHSSSRPSSGSRRRRRPANKPMDAVVKKQRGHSSEEYVTSDNDSIFSDDSLGRCGERHGDSTTLPSDLRSATEKTTADLGATTALTAVGSGQAMAEDSASSVPGLVSPVTRPQKGVKRRHQANEETGHSPVASCAGGNSSSREGTSRAPGPTSSASDAQQTLTKGALKGTFSLQHSHKGNNGQAQSQCAGKLSIVPVVTWQSPPTSQGTESQVDSDGAGLAQRRQKGKVGTASDRDRRQSQDKLTALHSKYGLMGDLAHPLDHEDHQDVADHEGSPSQFQSSVHRKVHKTQRDDEGKLRFEVTINKDETNVLYNVEKTEFKTYTLRDREGSVVEETTSTIVPDTININVTHTTTLHHEDKVEKVTTERVVFDDKETDENSDAILTERKFAGSHTLGLEQEKTENDISRGSCVERHATSEDCSSSVRVSQSSVMAEPEARLLPTALTDKPMSSAASKTSTSASVHDDSVNRPSPVCASSSVRDDSYPLMDTFKEQTGVAVGVSVSHREDKPELGADSAAVEVKATVPFPSPSELSHSDNGQVAGSSTDDSFHSTASSGGKGLALSESSREVSMSVNGQDQELANTSDTEVFCASLPEDMAGVKPGVASALLSVSSGLYPGRSTPVFGSEGRLALQSDISVCTEDSFHSADATLLSDCGSSELSEYRTPQQSPKGTPIPKTRVSSKLETVQVFSQELSRAPPDQSPNVGSPSSLAPGAAAERLTNGNAGVGNKKAPSSILSAMAAAVGRQLVGDDGQTEAMREALKQEVERKLATLQRRIRSLSDSAISSDFTETESASVSPRNSRIPVGDGKTEALASDHLAFYNTMFPPSQQDVHLVWADETDGSHFVIYPKEKTKGRPLEKSLEDSGNIHEDQWENTGSPEYDQVSAISWDKRKNAGTEDHQRKYQHIHNSPTPLRVGGQSKPGEPGNSQQTDRDSCMMNKKYLMSQTSENLSRSRFTRHSASGTGNGLLGLPGRFPERVIDAVLSVPQAWPPVICASQFTSRKGRSLPARRTKSMSNLTEMESLQEQARLIMQAARVPSGADLSSSSGYEFSNARREDTLYDQNGVAVEWLDGHFHPTKAGQAVVVSHHPQSPTEGISHAWLVSAEKGVLQKSAIDPSGRRQLVSSGQKTDASGMSNSMLERTVRHFLVSKMAAHGKDLPQAEFSIAHLDNACESPKQDDYDTEAMSFTSTVSVCGSSTRQSLSETTDDQTDGVVQGPHAMQSSDHNVDIFLSPSELELATIHATAAARKSQEDPNVDFRTLSPGEKLLLYMDSHREAVSPGKVSEASDVSLPRHWDKRRFRGTNVRRPLHGQSGRLSRGELALPEHLVHCLRQAQKGLEEHATLKDQLQSDISEALNSAQWTTGQRRMLRYKALSSSDLSYGRYTSEQNEQDFSGWQMERPASLACLEGIVVEDENQEEMYSSEDSICFVFMDPRTSEKSVTTGAMTSSITSEGSERLLPHSRSTDSVPFDGQHLPGFIPPLAECSVSLSNIHAGASSSVQHKGQLHRSRSASLLDVGTTVLCDDVSDENIFPPGACSESEVSLGAASATHVEDKVSCTGDELDPRPTCTDGSETGNPPSAALSAENLVRNKDQNMNPSEQIYPNADNSDCLLQSGHDNTAQKRPDSVAEVESGEPFFRHRSPGSRPLQSESGVQTEVSLKDAKHSVNIEEGGVNLENSETVVNARNGPHSTNHPPYIAGEKRESLEQQHKLQLSPNCEQLLELSHIMMETTQIIQNLQESVPSKSLSYGSSTESHLSNAVPQTVSQSDAKTMLSDTAQLLSKEQQSDSVSANGSGNGVDSASQNLIGAKDAVTQTSFSLRDLSTIQVQTEVMETSSASTSVQQKALSNGSSEAGTDDASYSDVHRPSLASTTCQTDEVSVPSRQLTRDASSSTEGLSTAIITDQSGKISVQQSVLQNTDISSNAQDPNSADSERYTVHMSAGKHVSTRTEDTNSNGKDICKATATDQTVQAQALHAASKISENSDTVVEHPRPLDSLTQTHHVEASELSTKTGENVCTSYSSVAVTDAVCQTDVIVHRDLSDKETKNASIGMDSPSTLEMTSQTDVKGMRDASSSVENVHTSDTTSQTDQIQEERPTTQEGRDGRNIRLEVSEIKSQTETYPEEDTGVKGANSLKNIRTSEMTCQTEDKVVIRSTRDASSGSPIDITVAASQTDAAICKNEQQHHATDTQDLGEHVLYSSEDGTDEYFPTEISAVQRLRGARKPSIEQTSFADVPCQTDVLDEFAHNTLGKDDIQSDARSCVNSGCQTDSESFLESAGTEMDRELQQLAALNKPAAAIDINRETNRDVDGRFERVKLSNSECQTDNGVSEDGFPLTSAMSNNERGIKDVVDGVCQTDLLETQFPGLTSSESSTVKTYYSVFSHVPEVSAADRYDSDSSPGLSDDDTKGASDIDNNESENTASRQWSQRRQVSVCTQMSCDYQSRCIAVHDDQDSAVERSGFTPSSQTPDEGTTHNSVTSGSSKTHQSSGQDIAGGQRVAQNFDSPHGADIPIKVTPTAAVSADHSDIHDEESSLVPASRHQQSAPSDPADSDYAQLTSAKPDTSVKNHQQSVDHEHRPTSDHDAINKPFLLHGESDQSDRGVQGPSDKHEHGISADSSVVLSFTQGLDSSEDNGLECVNPPVHDHSMAVPESSDKLTTSSPSQPSSQDQQTLSDTTVHDKSLILPGKGSKDTSSGSAAPEEKLSANLELTQLSEDHEGIHSSIEKQLTSSVADNSNSDLAIVASSGLRVESDPTTSSVLDETTSMTEEEHVQVDVSTVHDHSYGSQSRSVFSADSSSSKESSAKAARVVQERITSHLPAAEVAQEAQSLADTSDCLVPPTTPASMLQEHNTSSLSVGVDHSGQSQPTPVPSADSSDSSIPSDRGHGLLQESSETQVQTSPKLTHPSEASESTKPTASAVSLHVTPNQSKPVSATEPAQKRRIGEYDMRNIEDYNERRFVESSPEEIMKTTDVPLQDSSDSETEGEGELRFKREETIEESREILHPERVMSVESGPVIIVHPTTPRQADVNDDQVDNDPRAREGYRRSGGQDGEISYHLLDTVEGVSAAQLSLLGTRGERVRYDPMFSDDTFSSDAHMRPVWQARSGEFWKTSRVSPTGSNRLSPCSVDSRSGGMHDSGLRVGEFDDLSLPHRAFSSEILKLQSERNRMVELLERSRHQQSTQNISRLLRTRSASPRMTHAKSGSSSSGSPVTVIAGASSVRQSPVTFSASPNSLSFPGIAAPTSRRDSEGNLISESSYGSSLKRHSIATSTGKESLKDIDGDSWQSVLAHSALPGIMCTGSSPDLVQKSVSTTSESRLVGLPPRPSASHRKLIKPKAVYGTCSSEEEHKEGKSMDDVTTTETSFEGRVVYDRAETRSGNDGLQHTSTATKETSADSSYLVSAAPLDSYLSVSNTKGPSCQTDSNSQTVGVDAEVSPRGLDNPFDRQQDIEVSQPPLDTHHVSSRTGSTPSYSAAHRGGHTGASTVASPRSDLSQTFLKQDATPLLGEVSGEATDDEAAPDILIRTPRSLGGVNIPPIDHQLVPARSVISTGVEAVVNSSDDFTQTDAEDDSSLYLSQLDASKGSLSSSCNSETRRIRDELDRLHKERVEIIELLSLKYLPASLTVELLEAKLNYCLGQTDALLASLEKAWAEEGPDPAEYHLSKKHSELLAHYREQFEQSCQDLKVCVEEAYRTRTGTRGRRATRTRDLIAMQRRAQIEAFKEERKREQELFDRHRNISPDDSFISNNSAESNQMFSPQFMTPRQHKEHLVKLRRSLVASSVKELDELRQRSYSGSVSSSPDRSLSPVSSLSNVWRSRESNLGSSLSPDRHLAARSSPTNLTKTAVSTSTPVLSSSTDYGTSNWHASAGCSTSSSHSSSNLHEVPKQTLPSADLSYYRGHSLPRSSQSCLTPRSSSCGSSVSARHRLTPSLVSLAQNRYRRQDQETYGSTDSLDPEQMLRESYAARQLNRQQISKAQEALRLLEEHRHDFNSHLRSQDSRYHRQASRQQDVPQAHSNVAFSEQVIQREIANLQQQRLRSSVSSTCQDSGMMSLSLQESMSSNVPPDSTSTPRSSNSFAAYAKDILVRNERRIQTITRQTSKTPDDLHDQEPSFGPSEFSVSETQSSLLSTDLDSFLDSSVSSTPRFTSSRPVSSQDIKARIARRLKEKPKARK